MVKKTQLLSVFFLVFLCLVIFSIKSDVIATEAKKAECPEWQVGDKWIYQRDEQQIAIEVIGTEELDGKKCYALKRLGNKIIFTRDIENCGTKRGSDDEFITKWNPPQKFYSWPLEVGKKWKEKLRLFWDTTRWGKEGFNWDPDPVWRESKVIGIEEVIVPAGKFTAFHIYTTETMKGTTVEFHRWYSPQVKNVVWAKGYSRGIPWEEKLIAYSLK